jgi:hypothetical protein
VNLHGVVSGAIAAVNPFETGSIQTSAGTTTDDDGTQVPQYNPAVVLPMQVQPLQYRDIVHLDGLNIQGVSHKIYISGRVDGIIREQQKGGDLISIAGGLNKGLYLVSLVLEYWPDWCCVAVILQKGEPVNPPGVPGQLDFSKPVNSGLLNTGMV